ncbi:MAG: hypothetical protein GY851_18005 [bacterium]|nr:hypothetical protein [bacterium]
MRKLLVALCVIGIGVGFVAEQAFCGNRSDDPLGVAVSPQTFLLRSDQGGEVTVHTDIPLAIVDRGSVELNGIPALYTKADARGCLVGKFSEDAVKAIVSAPKETLTLTGLTEDGMPFSGSDTVRVIL